MKNEIEKYSASVYTCSYDIAYSVSMTTLIVRRLPSHKHELQIMNVHCTLYKHRTRIKSKHRRQYRLFDSTVSKVHIE